MPRNGAGVFNLAQPAFQSQTPISSSAVNADLSDIADGLTASLPRDGQGAMTAVLPLASTGFVYASDPNTGMRRTAADEQAIQCGGIDVLIASTTGVDFPLTATIGGQPLVPAGITAHTAAATAPSGWLIRDGSAVSRTTYAALFTAIGTTYGAGDGATTFNVPDARGRVDAGVDGGAGRLTSPYYGSTAALGVPGGGENWILSAAQLPLITPTFTGTAASWTGTLNNSNIPANASVISNVAQGGVASVIGAGSIVGTANVTTNVTPSGTISSFGSGAPHRTIQPTMTLTPIIKT